MNREAEEGQDFLMPLLSVVVIVGAQSHVCRQDATLACVISLQFGSQKPLAGVTLDAAVEM